jgi:ATP-dependent DNA helicase RecQ
MSSLAESLPSLRQLFGFDQFREGQEEVINATLAGKDAVVVMPTGSGKSLCYQLPAMLRNGATLVVSPLIALMKDQVDALQARGLPATFINSSINEAEQHKRIEGLRKGQYKLVYVAPERFRSPRFISVLQSVSVSLLAIDEAHCISTWGHDFRPDYLRLKSVRESLNKPQTIALTATATPYVRSDIIQQLGLTSPQTFVSGFDRPNLSIQVARVQKEREKFSRIRRLADAVDGSGIIYASTRKAVEELGQELNSYGLATATYHGGMSDAVRIKEQDLFMSGRKRIIVATNAFGMGIDKSDIRFVVHFQMPGSIEAYYQEIGRAGRDGLNSACLLLFNYADKNTHDFFIEGSYPEQTLVRQVYSELYAIGSRMVQLSNSELARRVGERNEMAVQSSIYLLERAGHIERTGSRNRKDDSRGILLLDPKPVTQLRINQQDLARRAALERHKLREMIEFCYTEDCFRAYILDYFGDRHHSRECGTCGNCDSGLRLAPAVSKNQTAVQDLDELEPRDLSDDELLRMRKILACAKRMKGRFGKSVLAGTLRGSAAKSIFQARLNDLSTYGILSGMRHDDIMLYIDSLLFGKCLTSSKGAYPTILITELGERVMREQEVIKLPLPLVAIDKTRPRNNVRSDTPTRLETYNLFKEGLSLPDIAERRSLQLRTIEDHLADCIRVGLEIDLDRLVSFSDQELIATAIEKVGYSTLKPLRDVLPGHISYGMIKFVLARYQRTSAQAG